MGWCAVLPVSADGQQEAWTERVAHHGSTCCPTSQNVPQKSVWCSQASIWQLIDCRSPTNVTLLDSLECACCHGNHAVDTWPIVSEQCFTSPPTQYRLHGRRIHDPYQTFQTQLIHNWMAVHCVKYLWSSYFDEFVPTCLMASCKSAWLTRWLANRQLTLIIWLTRFHIARMPVS